ncbi:siphovirus Gp157 family protein [Nevskia soli]|uniref:siphovirus Gp157 family protein n=1 Tax=Nevskia soli TaxID=418856 RepID=UPI0015D68A39|nr:siphovirus Gp157 family protein [Nevskia soli]
MIRSPQLYAVIPNTARTPDTPKKTGRATARVHREAEYQTKTKIDRAFGVLSRLDERIEECDEQIAAWQTRKRLWARRIERIEERVLETMDQANISFAPGFHHEFKSSPCPVSVDVFDLKLLPKEFLRQPKTPAAAPDKNAIRLAIEAEKSVPGARLVQNVSLQRK